MIKAIKNWFKARREEKEFLIKMKKMNLVDSLIRVEPVLDGFATRLVLDKEAFDTLGIEWNEKNKALAGEYLQQKIDGFDRVRKRCQ